MDTEAYAYRTIGVLAAGNRIAACTHSRPPKTCARTMGLGTWGSDSHFRGAQTINAEYREPVDLGSAKPLETKASHFLGRKHYMVKSSARFCCGKSRDETDFFTRHHGG